MWKPMHWLSKVGDGGVQGVMLDLAVRGLGKVSLRKKKRALWSIPRMLCDTYRQKWHVETNMDQEVTEHDGKTHWGLSESEPMCETLGWACNHINALLNMPSGTFVSFFWQWKRKKSVTQIFKHVSVQCLASVLKMTNLLCDTGDTELKSAELQQLGSEWKYSYHSKEGSITLRTSANILITPHSDIFEVSVLCSPDWNLLQL